MSEGLKVIKEPIHDYIAFSRLEFKLINDPLFLRLQNISQNGLAYLTYPSNRTSRFIHCLGTMYIGGAMVQGVLRTSDAMKVRFFLKKFKALLEISAGEEKPIDLGAIQTFVAKDDDLFYKYNGLDPKKRDNFHQIVLLQAVRIACVMHDLGHPPFSHTVEAVLQSKRASQGLAEKSKEYVRYGQIFKNLFGVQTGQLHEAIGTALTLKVFADVADDYADFGRLCFRIAKKIAIHEQTDEDADGVLSCLGSIVSSKTIDADRCDYVLRDGDASSFEFGEYDLLRILQNLRLNKNDQGRFEIVSTTTAVSALESFFLERYRIWRWIVFHPNVVRAEMALSRAMAILLEIAFEDKPSDQVDRAIRQRLDDRNFRMLWRAFESPNSYRRYVECDESWLRALLRDIQGQKYLAGPLPRRTAMLKIYLNFVLDRDKPSFKALWKRAEEYDQFAVAAVKSAEKHPDKLAKIKLLPDGRPATEWFNELLRVVLHEDLKKGQVECMRRLEEKVQHCLGDAGYQGALLTRVLDFSPYDECFVLNASGNKLPLTRLSSVVANIPSTWKKDIQFRAYWVGLRKSGRRWILHEESTAPPLDKLAECILSALLADGKWDSLKVLLEA